MSKKPLIPALTAPPQVVQWVHAPNKDVSGISEVAQREIDDTHELTLLRRVMASSQDCIKILNLEGRLLWMNEGGQRCMEIDDFEIQRNQLWINFWLPAERAAALTAFELAKNNGIGKFTGFCPTAKGTPRWWEVVISPLRNDQGLPEQILCVSRDITDSTEGALLKAGALQSAIFNSANFSSIATDAQGIIQIFNVGAERMLGYTAAEVMNKMNPADFCDPGELIARAEALSVEIGFLITPGFERLVFKASRGIEDIYELTYIRKDGSRLPAVVSVTALRDDQGDIIGYLLIGTDNTARKRAEAALLEAGALQSAIFNSANFSSIATDAQGVIQIFNVGAERMLGYTAAEVMNRVTPANISDPQEVIARAEALTLELGTPITPGFEALVYKASRGIEDIYELTYIRKDGSRFPAIVSVTALRDAQGEIIGYLLIGTDNTARKQAEEALRANYALLRTIHLHSIVSVTDRAGRIVDANEGFCNISGYSRDELRGQTHRIVNSGVQARAFWTDMWHSITAGQPWRGEICNRAKDGSLYWVDSIIAPFMSEDGHTERFISVRTDITARKRAEEALLKAGALQSAIFNSANFSSIATDAQGVIQIFNVGAERMLGYTAAEVMNKITPADISDPMEVIIRAQELSVELDTPITPGFEALVYKAARGIEDIYELTYFRKDGSRFPAVVSVTALRDAQETIIGYLLIGTDNTARKRTEQALQESEQRARRILDTAHDAFVAMDSADKITDWNVQAERLFGWSRQEAVGCTLSDTIIPPRYRDAHLRGLQQFLATGEGTVLNKTIEIAAQHRDGREIPVTLSIWAVVVSQGYAFNAFIHDNTAHKQAEAALLKAGALQSAISNSANFSSIATDAQGVIQIFNVGAEHMLGYTAAEVMNKITPADISDPMEVIIRAQELSVELGTPITPGFEALVYKAARGIEDIYELTYFRKDGSRFPAVAILYVNPLWEKLTGWRVAAGDSVDKIIDVIHPDDALRVRHEAGKVATKSMNVTREGDVTQRIRHQASRLAAGDIDQDSRLMRPDGAVRWVHIRSFPIADSAGNIYQVAGIMEDITDRKNAEQRLLELAHFDPLTGLPNRRHYYESLERALVLASAQALFVSVLFIDLDRFKEVNDTLGHALGDELLRKVSQRMIQCVRASDIIGRLGGDEFALILMNSGDPHITAIVANAIIHELRRPFDLDGHEVTVTASIGIAAFPVDSMDAATLMKYADTAMYEAKNAGRDIYRFYSAGMNTRAQEKHDLELALHNAIEHDEFVLHYQPVMDISSGQWTGVEALLRWNRPGHGFISPANFIPALEETGLIVAVGAWVINAACKQIADWERSGLGWFWVAVNVSARQFSLIDKVPEERRVIRAGGSNILLADFTQTVASALTEHRIAPRLLELELTEGTLMSDVGKTVGILQKLQALGIRISIDDFGTGYSSLAYLRRFPLHTLKIDQAFIRDATSNAEDAAITLAIISMAHSLKLNVIAEGVETTEQLDFLRAHGCDQAQGYLIARPMPATELAALFRAGK